MQTDAATKQKAESEKDVAVSQSSETKNEQTDWYAISSGNDDPRCEQDDKIRKAVEAAAHELDSLCQAHDQRTSDPKDALADAHEVPEAPTFSKRQKARARAKAKLKPKEPNKPPMKEAEKLREAECEQTPENGQSEDESDEVCNGDLYDHIMKSKGTDNQDIFVERYPQRPVRH